jgi:hypothetical protein
MSAQRVKAFIIALMLALTLATGATPPAVLASEVGATGGGGGLNAYPRSVHSDGRLASRSKNDFGRSCPLS